MPLAPPPERSAASFQSDRPKWPLANLAVLLALLSAACTAAPCDADDAGSADAFGWLIGPRAPRFHVLDTESSLGPYAQEDKEIALEDLVKMHGHVCDGLVTAACALKVGLDALYPDGVIDRTDTGCITRNSPCYGDVAAYLTGGRIRFGTQKIDPGLGDAFLLRRFSTGETVRVSLREGVFPAELAALETRIRGGDFTEQELRACQQLGWDFARAILERPLHESFERSTVTDMVWVPDRYEHLGTRSDVVNKGARPMPSPDHAERARGR